MYTKLGRTNDTQSTYFDSDAIIYHIFVIHGQRLSSLLFCDCAQHIHTQQDVLDYVGDSVIFINIHATVCVSVMAKSNFNYATDHVCTVDLHSLPHAI